MARPADSSSSLAGSTAPFRLLVIATESVGPSELEQELRNHAEGRDAEIRIIAPAVVDSAFEHAAGSVDDGIAAAHERLEETRKRLQGSSFTIESVAIGDSDPMLALEDGLRIGPADEILLVTHPDEQAKWLEEDLFDRARKTVSVPLTHVVVSQSDGQRQADEVEHSDPGVDRSGEAEVEAPLDSTPKRMTTRDVVGLIVAVAGTIVAAILASSCLDTGSDQLRDSTDAACTAQLIIAGGVALMNIAHVVGLVLFSSVGYRGIAERFFSRFAMFVTPLAIATILILKAVG